MRRILSVLLLVCIAAPGASAAAYDDFSRGLGASQRGANDNSIAAFTSAIVQGGLNPAYLPTAYRGRAAANLAAQHCQPALDDIGRAIALAPADNELLHQRALIYECLGQNDKALADYTALINAQFTVMAWRWRGLLRWRQGDFAGASADFDALIERQPHDAWSMLWRAATRERAGTPDPATVAKNIDDLNSSDWPIPLFKVYAGKSKPEAVASAVARFEDSERAGHQCEADFYLGEWGVARDPAAAKALLQRAAEQCPRDYPEKTIAGAEVERLK